MSPLYEGIPAIIYTGLWNLKIFKRLNKVFPEAPMKIAILLTDSPPAFLVDIKKNDFKITFLEDISDVRLLDEIECDSYLAIPTEILYQGPEGIRNGISEGKVLASDLKVILTLAKISGVS